MKNEEKYKTYRLDLIATYLTKGSQENSDEEFNNWLAKSEDNRIYFNEIKKLWDSMEMANANPHYDAIRAYEFFKYRIYGRTNPVRKTGSIRKYLYVAAVFIPFLFSTYFTYSYFNRQLPVVKKLGLTEVVVPNGSKTHLKLQDGTNIWLNSGSKIEYDTDFGSQKREICLSGEAYLEVAHNEDIPLIVTAGEIKVKVLGTRFNINAYQENNTAKVALFNGSVEVAANNDLPVLLSPKEVASYNSDSHQITVKFDDTDHYLNWLEDKLTFDGETFEQIIGTLERRFDMRVNIHREDVKSRSFVGDFVNNETVEQIFNVMSSDGKFEYRIKGNTIDVY